MLSFDDKKYMEVRPFTSKSVHDPIVSAKALETFRGLSRLNDHTYLSYLLYVDQNIEFALKNSTFRSKHVQDLLLELQSMVYKAEENKIAEELIAVTKQLLFKFSADFLISSDEEKDLICILSSLSYHSVDCVIFENTDLAAYSAILALDSLTLLLHTYDDTYGNVWTDSELGCHIVHAIIPNDEHICRLHSALYQNARDCSESLLPMLKDELPETFADHILPFLEHDRILRILIMAMRRLPITETEYSFDLFRFFNHFVRQLKTTPSQDEFAKFDSKFFTSADFALFLEWLKQWSEVSQSTVKIASKIVFTKEQLLHWESITAHIKEQRITSEQRLRVSSVIRTVRLDKSYRNIRILYAIFKFIRENAFPSIWRQGYASLIVKNLQNIEYTETSKNHLFHIMAFEEMISVDEEELIYRDLEKSLAPPTDFEPNDENKNNSVCGSGQEKEKETKSYTIYSHCANNTPERAASEADSVENYETSQSPPSDGEISQSFFITDISIDEESYILNAIQQTLHSTMQMYKDVEGSIAASLDKRLGPDPEDCRRLHSYSIQPAINGVLRDGDLLSFLDQQMKLDTAKDAEKISSLIERCGNLKALELKGNTLGIEAGERISASLERHSELQRCLWSDLFTGRLKTEIPPVLRCLTNALITARCHITELDLSDNAFGPIGAEGIQDFLISPAAYTLEVLKLNNNGLGGGGKIIAECLLQCHANANRDRTQFKLKTFVAGRNRLEDPGAIALAKAFSAIGTLENIQIPQNGIRLKGITALAESFEYNRHLKTIVLNDNTCGADGAYLIAKSLTNLVNLEILDLGDCLCRSDGCGAVIAVVCDGRHHNIKMVDLSGSELPAKRASLIITSWMQSFTCTGAFLKLSNNMFGSMFPKLEDRIKAKSLKIDIGDIDDDEGSGDDDGESDEDGNC